MRSSIPTLSHNLDTSISVNCLQFIKFSIHPSSVGIEPGSVVGESLWGSGIFPTSTSIFESILKGSRIVPVKSKNSGEGREWCFNGVFGSVGWVLVASGRTSTSEIGSWVSEAWRLKRLVIIQCRQGGSWGNDGAILRSLNVRSDHLSISMLLFGLWMTVGKSHYEGTKPTPGGFTSN